MRRFIRCAFIGLLAVALTASGSVLSAASRVAQGNAHAGHASHHAASDETHAHHHRAEHHDMAQDEALPQDHASNTCCSMCTVASPLPPATMAAVQFATAPAEYAPRTAFAIAVKIAIDPGIPKRTG